MSEAVRVRDGALVLVPKRTLPYLLLRGHVVEERAVTALLDLGPAGVIRGLGSVGLIDWMFIRLQGWEGGRQLGPYNFPYHGRIRKLAVQ